MYLYLSHMSVSPFLFWSHFVVCVRFWSTGGGCSVLWWMIRWIIFAVLYKLSFISCWEVYCPKSNCDKWVNTNFVCCKNFDPCYLLNTSLYWHYLWSSAHTLLVLCYFVCVLTKWVICTLKKIKIKRENKNAHLKIKGIFRDLWVIQAPF